MEQFVGMSKECNVDEATNGLSKPQFIIMVASDREKFKENVEQLERKFPGVPSIGCVGQSYGRTQVVENGMLIVALQGGITVESGIITEVSIAPVKSIKSIQENISKINPGNNNTVLIDFCSGNDECVITTIQSAIGTKNIQLTGGTAWEGLVSCNGKVYEDACTYALVKNNNGKVKVYKENIYTPTDKIHVCTRAVPAKYTLCELDGRSAESVYIEELGISPENIEKQTFKNPFGRCIGEEVYIVSIKEKMSNGDLACYRKVNPKDKLCILEAGDDQAILESTVNNIKKDFSHISGIFSINCIFRYLYFKDLGHIDNYLQRMLSLGQHAGLIGMGEHFNKQHTNQTMSCVVFE